LNEIHGILPVVLPLHPRTKEFLRQHKISLHVKQIDPLGYFDMLTLLENCKLVLTDSGGLQKEAYFFGKFCITLRDQTEWIELVDAGANETVGANSQAIFNSFSKNKSKAISTKQLYGAGDAAEKIVKRLVSFDFAAVR
jgi:UDP-GlcNAc3NAcA epimerase